MSETKTLEDQILAPVLTAGYGDLTAFATELANRINDVVSFDEKPSGDLVARVLFEWAKINAEPDADV